MRHFLKRGIGVLCWLALLVAGNRDAAAVTLAGSV